MFFVAYMQPSLSMPFQSAQPTQNTGGFGFGAPAGDCDSMENFLKLCVNYKNGPCDIVNMQVQSQFQFCYNKLELGLNL